MWLRISAIVMRYFFLHRRSVARVMEIFFWPVMNLIVWGFVTYYLKELALPKTVLFLLGSVILWDVALPFAAGYYPGNYRRILGEEYYQYLYQSHQHG